MEMEKYKVGDLGELGVKMYDIVKKDCRVNYGDVMRDFLKIVANPQVDTWLWSTRESGSQIKQYGSANTYYDNIRDSEDLISEFRLENFDIIGLNNEWYMFDNKGSDTIVECRSFNIEDLHCLCVENDFYDAGTNEEYDAMFDMARKAGFHVKTDDVKLIADDIIDHTSIEVAREYRNPDQFIELMQLVLSCTSTWFEEAK